jgi:ribonuclease E
MERLLLINASETDETRIVLLEGGRVEEYRRERAAGSSLVGNVYKGRVVNLETPIGAAFVDIGIGRNGFLHESDLPGGGEARGSGDAGGLPPLGAEIVVQVTRDSVGPKGPVLSADPSLPGRFLVLLPLSRAGGVSRRIATNGARDQLRALARALGNRAGAGLIVRTAAAEATARELARDLRSLQRLWASIEERSSSASPPALLHAEGDLIGRTLRDRADGGLDAIVVDTPEALARVEEALRTSRKAPVPRVRLHEGPAPLFHAFGVEEQVDQLLARRVPLPGGGSLVIDRTEAMVAIDVNSGRSREESGLEETALRTNLEAAAEAARQIRLRDLGGVVAVDFIDMKSAGSCRAVERAFREALRRDPAPVNAGKLGQFAVFVLTRRRAGGDGVAGGAICPRCGGAGQVVSPDTVALRVFRELMAKAAGRGRSPLTARLAPEAAERLRTVRAGALRALSEERGREIRVEAEPSFPPDRWEIAPSR